MKNVRFIGLDVHAETIAVAEPGGEIRSLGTIPNRPESVGRLMRKLGKPDQLRVCYEAGPTGYVLYWQLSELGVRLVSRDHSSGERIRRGAISKTGNAHLRRIVIEAAWAYRHRPGLGASLLARQREQSEEIKAVAWRAQHRLHARYAKLLAKGKAKQQVVTAVGRELLGFIWAIGVAAERSQSESPRRALKRAA